LLLPACSFLRFEAAAAAVDAPELSSPSTALLPLTPPSIDASSASGAPVAFVSSAAAVAAAGAVAAAAGVVAPRLR
jgi:hypothetical protein